MARHGVLSAWSLTHLCQQQYTLVTSSCELPRLSRVYPLTSDENTSGKSTYTCYHTVAVQLSNLLPGSFEKQLAQCFQHMRSMFNAIC
jgi:hypothetical protein